MRAKEEQNITYRRHRGRKPDPLCGKKKKWLEKKKQEK
jgi:hypothetical protein